jgi:hypothetical protein
MATNGNSNKPAAKRRLYFSSQPQLLLCHEKDSEYVAHIASQLTVMQSRTTAKKVMMHG